MQSDNHKWDYLRRDTMGREWMECSTCGIKVPKLDMGQWENKLYARPIPKCLTKEERLVKDIIL